MQIVVDKIKKEFGYELESASHVYLNNYKNQIRRWIIFLFVVFIAILILPWTQNIRSSGNITTLYQDQRPQELNAIIPGRIIKWHVKEGDFVRKGDTIIQLADVKDDYLDPNLVQRTEEQLTAKKQKIGFYGEKIQATESQIDALTEGRALKISSLQNKMEQYKRKVQSDSAEWKASTIDYQIAHEQFERAKQMHNDGIISLVDFERRTASYQKAIANQTEKYNKYLNTKQDLVITSIEIGNTQQEIADKIFKARSEQAGSQSDIETERGEVAKLENQVQNYRIRGSQRWLLAPQDGQVVSAKKAGINEIVKEGEMIVQVVPNQVDFAVEIYVKPFDLVLLDTGQTVRFIFDGYPAVVFSGWPSASYGAFTGKIKAISTNRSDNGMFRVLVIEDPNERQWPPDLKMGTGAVGFALLKEVPIWYELWRNINGFPPEFYKDNPEEKSSKPKA